MGKPTQTSTEEIIRGLKDGRDEEGNYKLLFERYYDQLYRFFQRKGLPDQDCRDLTQEVFISIYKGLKGLRDETQFQSWMFKIARNVYASELERRQAKKRSAREVPIVDGQDIADYRHPTRWQSSDSPLAKIIEQENRDKLGEAIEGLPLQMRRCVKLRVAKGLSNADIAAVLGISANTVKSHLQQATKILKEKLGRHLTMLLM